MTLPSHAFIRLLPIFLGIFIPDLKLLCLLITHTSLQRHGNEDLPGKTRNDVYQVGASDPEMDMMLCQRAEARWSLH